MDRSTLQQVLDANATRDCLRCNAETSWAVYRPGGTDDHVFRTGRAADFVDFGVSVLEPRPI